VSFTEWMQRHRRSILFLIAVLTVGGLVSTFSLPVALFPHVDFPRVVISIDAGDRPAGLMALKLPDLWKRQFGLFPVYAISGPLLAGVAQISQ